MSEHRLPTVEQIEQRAYELYLSAPAKTVTTWQIGLPPRKN